MLLDLATMLSLAPACAPAVAPATLLAVAHAESGFDPLAIGVNGPHPSRLSFTSRDAAASAARRLIADGQNVDLGLAQINIRNLAGLGLTIEGALDPCRNLAAAAKVLGAGYARAAPRVGEEQAGLRTALSYYNTGTPDRGFRNGYVDRVVAAAAKLAIAPVWGPAGSSAPRSPSWDAFGELRTSSFLIRPSLTQGAVP